MNEDPILFLEIFNSAIPVLHFPLIQSPHLQVHATFIHKFSASTTRLYLKICVVTSLIYKKKKKRSMIILLDGNTLSFTYTMYMISPWQTNQ